jgi:APA family basic amino acid/polyamine antiporter
MSQVVGAQGAAPAPGGASEAVFVRQATGLVRGVKPWTAAILNFCPGHPAQVLAVGFFFAFALFPGGSYLLSLAILLPMSIAMSYAFGLLTTMIPRDGGDYMIVSRVLHPLLGVISSFCMTAANLLSNAFFGIGFVTISLGPGLIAVGLIGHDDTLVRWGTDIQGSFGWKLALGTAMMLLPVLALATGWTWTRRLLNTAFWIVSGGLLVAVAIALFTTHGHFVSSLNSLGASFGHGDAYQEVLASAKKNGVELDPSFSLSNTIPMTGLFAGFAIFSYFSTFVGGELRRASSIKTAHNMALAGVVGIVLAGLFGTIFFHTFGHDFMIGVNAAGLPGDLGAESPTYWFLTSVSVGSSFFTALLVLSYMVFFPLISYLAFMQPTRMLFAYSFDGLLPRRVSEVSSSGAPWTALAIAFVLTEATFIWALKASSFLQVLVYATLLQLAAMALVCLSAIVVPYLRPAFYRASASHKKVLGLPVVTLAGLGGLLTCVFVWVLYFHYDEFGLVNRGKFFGIFAGIVAAACLLYFGAQAVRKREGVDVRLAYAEIPPE